MGSETDHVVMVPFMAQGHLRPFLHLAHRLHSQSPSPLTISILTTPLNAAYLRRILHPTTTAAIEIVDLPFNSSDHGLPENIENTDKLPLPLVINLFHASTSLEPHLRRFLSLRRRPPVCIIFDVFLGWANGVAKSVGSTGIAFTTGGAYGTAAYVSIWNDLPHRSYSDEEDFPLPGFPENHRFSRSQLHRFLRFADGSDNWSKFFQPQIRSSMESSGWLCNSIEEMEPLGFQILRNYIKIPVWGIGPLIPSSVERSSSSSSDEECIHWLNAHKPDSVLYISFGSQNTISPIQMMELATGLEQSGKPFLWVIRPPYGFDINQEFRPEWLPEGFEGRMMASKQGILVHKWGPQLEILSHESTGAFLSHCGWNSVLESLSRGVPMIGWPLAAEQAYNSKMLVEETGVAVELTRGLEGKLGKEDVKKVVDLVLGREEGSHGWEMKKKAVEMGKKLKDALREEEEESGYNKGSSINAMNDF